MENTDKNYILTGSTGILGSHILYELMQVMHNNDYCGKIVLLLRSRKNMSCRQRFEELFKAEVMPDYLLNIDIDRICKNNVLLVDFDLRNIAEAELASKLGPEKYHLIHCAASVNLGTNTAALDEVKHSNYLGTLHLIHTLHQSLSKISYISTAFSLSGKHGQIYEHTTGRGEEDFRNYYERFKVQTEQEVIEICEAYALPYQIFRPSIICGRLVDYPHHVIPKFLVFYMFGAFFYRAMQTYNDQHVRILMNSSSDLNLIPVDYAAKAIVRALDTDIKELNVVSKNGVRNTYTIPEMLRLIGWNNYEFMEEMPENQTPLEKLYYRTVGAQLNNYLLTPGTNSQFDTNELSELMKDIAPPSVKVSFRSYVHTLLAGALITF